MKHPIRILLVCADVGFAETVAAALEDENEEFVVTVAPTASKGSDWLRSDTFDCVVSEHSLQEQNGIEFLETVREISPGLPFVLYTDNGSEDVAAAAISADVTKYLQRGDTTDRYGPLAQQIQAAVEASKNMIEIESRRPRIEKILHTVPGCVVELDVNGRFVYANQRAEEVLGLDESQITRRTYNDSEWEIRDVQGNPIPDEQLPFRQVSESGEPLHGYEHSIRWPDGSEKVLLVSGAPLFDHQGNVETVVFSMVDITDQKQREKELGRAQHIIEHLDDLATIITPEGTITYVSPAVKRVLGYEPHELIGENGFGYQPPETSEKVVEAIETVLSNPGETETVQTKFRRADGSWCWIESTLRNHVDDDVIDGILVSSREVTERVTQKRQLERRERQLSQLHEATRELLASETPQEVAATASRTAVDILDLPLNGIHFYDEDVDGLRPVAVSDASRELFDEVPVIDKGIAWRAFQTKQTQIHHDVGEASEVYNLETPIKSEIHIPLLDRGVFIISATEKDAFEESDIEFARILAANTEAALQRIDKEQQLRIRETELQQQNERLEEFASIVSHDLRNPLNVAQAHTGLLSEEHDSEHLLHVSEALARMEELISDTLTLASQGKIVAGTEPISLMDLVGQCWNSVSTGEATIKIDEEVTIQGDQSRLRHVFENLFRNTLEHGGPTVSVSVGLIGDDGLYVEDTGPGIPEAKREVVFEAGHTSAPDGTGFGLTIVKRIAEAHGWEVSVTAGTNGGARFEFTGVEIAR